MLISEVVYIAICINQNDNEEHEKQVGCVTDIFARASLVIVWLEKIEVERVRVR